MTTPRPHPDPLDPAREADRLGDAWDALVAGHRATPSEGDAEAELLTVVGRLTAEAPVTGPTPTFRRQLRETLMHASPSTTPAALAIRPFLTLGRPVEVTSPSRPPGAGAAGRFQGTGVRFATVAAAIALLLATAGYLGVGGPGNGAGTTSIPAPMVESPTGAVAVLAESPTPTVEREVPTVTSIAEAVLPTVTPLQSPTATPAPSATSADPCAGADPILPCGAPVIVAQGLIAGSLYPDEITEGVQDVEMSTWSITPVQRASFPTWTAPPAGMGMDIVVEGVYAASFTGPAVVSRKGYGTTGYEYPVTGDMVELVPGDTVSYALGTRAEVANPLATQTLTFKSLEFSSPVIAPDSTPNPAAGRVVQGNYEMHLDGQGALPQPIDVYSNRDVSIDLTYSQISRTVPLSEDDESAVVIGPVPTGLTTDAGGSFTVWAYDLSG